VNWDSRNSDTYARKALIMLYELPVLFVYDHALSPKQNLLRCEGLPYREYKGVCSSDEIANLSRLTGRSTATLVKTDTWFLREDMRRNPRRYEERTPS
jgi:hypothetical protein